MRIRILRNFSNKGVSYQAGVIVDVGPGDAEKWCSHGLAMKDKSVDIPEVKAPETPDVDIPSENVIDALQSKSSPLVEEVNTKPEVRKPKAKAKRKK